MKSPALYALLFCTFAASATASVADYPIDLYSRPSVLPKGVAEGQIDFTADVGDLRAFEHALLSPNLRLGVTDDLTIGLNHGRTGAPLSQGAICFGDVCGTEQYNNVALEAFYQLQRGSTSVAGIFSFEANQLAPEFALSARIGADLRWKAATQWMLQLTPQLGAGLLARDLEVNTGISRPYNRDYITMPVALNFRQSDQLNLQLLSGLSGSLSGLPFDSTFRVPVGVGAMYASGDHKFDVGARFVMPALLAGSAFTSTGEDGFRSRELGVFLNFRN